MAYTGYTAVQFDPNANRYDVFLADRCADGVRENVAHYPTRGEALCAAHDRDLDVYELNALPRETFQVCLAQKLGLPSESTFDDIVAAALKWMEHLQRK